MSQTAVANWLERPIVLNGIIAVIVFNAVILGLETSDVVMASVGPLIRTLDTLCLAVFVVEILLKLYAYRQSFFRSGWNLFDFTIVAVSFVPGGQGFSVLRALRILRVLRVVSATPRLRRVVEGFVTALPGMGSVFLLMGLIFYIGAVMATKLFAASFPDWFGTLGRSAYSLFQIMTLESWSMGLLWILVCDHFSSIEWCLISDECVDDGQKLACNSHDDGLVGFAFRLHAGDEWLKQFALSDY